MGLNRLDDIQILFMGGILHSPVFSLLNISIEVLTILSLRQNLPLLLPIFESPVAGCRSRSFSLVLSLTLSPIH